MDDPGPAWAGDGPLSLAHPAPERSRDGPSAAFPDEHILAGNDRSKRRQVGNAVPVALAEYVGLEIRRQLLDDNPGRGATTIPEHRDDCPEAEQPADVPAEYLHLVGQHEDHPGAGAGPGARRTERRAADNAAMPTEVGSTFR